MKLTLLGTDGPLPDPDRHASAAVLEVGDARLRIDTGRGVVSPLVRASIPIDRVQPIFLTHHHRVFADAVVHGHGLHFPAAFKHRWCVSAAAWRPRARWSHSR